jgi:hypothetical protein
MVKWTILRRGRGSEREWVKTGETFDDAHESVDAYLARIMERDGFDYRALPADAPVPPPETGAPAPRKRKRGGKAKPTA